MSCTGAPVVLYISDLLGSFFFLKSLFGTNLGDHVDSCFFFFKLQGIWDLSSQTRDQSGVPCIGSAES